MTEKPKPLTPSELAHGCVRGREVLAVLLLVVLCDLTIFRGHGFAGYALLFALAPLGLALGAPRPRFGPAFWIVGGMSILLAAKLLWCGWWLAVGVGFALTIGLAMALAGLRPCVVDGLAYVLQTPVAGAQGLFDHARATERPYRALLRTGLLSVLLPAVALLVFGTLFVLANPDLAVSLRAAIRQAFTSAWHWLARHGPSFGEVLFWLAVAWVAAGLLRPALRHSLFDRLSAAGGKADRPAERVPSLWYGPFRNMLAAVIVLFAVYLVFELATLWGREFPEGFYYAGYAHEGAAWLTAALALATLVLSLIFRGSVLRDPRLPRLRRLTWVWSVENALLAASVYNRLFIYINFNGMTRMRTVGLFGMTLVLAGFLLVVWKVAYHRDFVWLVRRQLWALAAAVYLFAVTPVDVLVHAYNVRQILAGDLAPSVQISVHPIDSAGILVLPPLLDSDDEIIREGIRAMLAERYVALEARTVLRERCGWTTYQLADQALLAHLGRLRAHWEVYADFAKRRQALDRFDEYAYQWY